jgi:hypothetical protein
MRQDQISVVPIVLVLFAIAGFVLLVGMLAFMGFLISRAVKRRSYDPGRGAEMQEVARWLGFTFRPEAALAELPCFGGFELFEGYPLKAENLMTGSSRGHDLSVFDLAYRNVGEAGGTTTSRQTMVVVRSSALALPIFYLRPEGALETVLDTMSRVDIDFPERPAFSSRYLLYGPDEAAIRRLFTVPRLDALEHYPDLCIAGRGNCLFFYTSRTLGQPSEVTQYVGFTEQLHEVFRAT